MRQDMTKEAAEEILELPRRYTRDDVRRAYTELARRYHPDAAAQHRYDPAAAQARMVEVNKANEVLKVQFADAPDRVVERGWDESDSVWNHWDEVGDEDLGATSAPVEKVPLSVRSVLLGPVVLRVVFVALLGLLWWRTFPLLPENLPAYLPAGDWTLVDVARLVAGMVYPTYVLVYEGISGYVSGFVREVANGAVSWMLRRYVDLRPKSSSYGCALYKLLREQVYALLMAPLVLYVAAAALGETGALRVALGVLALVLGIDTLAACVRGGFVNTWSSALAERVEARYLLARAQLLRRCGYGGA